MTVFNAFPNTKKHDIQTLKKEPEISNSECKLLENQISIETNPQDQPLLLSLKKKEIQTIEQKDFIPNAGHFLGDYDRGLYKVLVLFIVL
jgi:hypothetical protein